MNPREWQQYSQRLLTSQTSPTKNAPLHLATLKQTVIDALGFDPKLMASDKAILHGGRGRQKNGAPNPKRDLSLPQIAAMPKHLANPDSIHRDTENQSWLFVYGLNTKEEARVVFRQNSKRPLQLISYTKMELGITEANYGIPRYKK